MLSSTKVNLLCLSVLHLLLCHLPTKSLNASSTQNNEFEIATKKSYYCHLLFIQEGSTIFTDLTLKTFIIENNKTLQKVKMPNNSHRSIDVTTKEARSMPALLFHCHVVYKIKFTLCRRVLKASKHISIYTFLLMHCQVHKYLCSLFTIDRFF